MNQKPEWAIPQPQPEITTMQYAMAVSHLIGMAQKDCSGSRACAQVLLSAYNGD